MLRLLVFELLAFLLIFPLEGNPQSMLQKANLMYQKGETATSFQERKLAFNQALYFYSLLEEEAGSHFPTLNQALADTYFQLGEYAWAILYYERALKMHDEQPILTAHLGKAQQKLGLASQKPVSPSKSPIFQFFLNLSESTNLFFSLFLLAFLLCSFAIWFPLAPIRLLAISSTIILLLFISNVIFFYYFTPLEGILVTSSGFYRAPAWNQPQLTDRPLLAGSKVKVLQTVSDGNWLKIVDSNDVVGYIPTYRLRLI